MWSSWYNRFDLEKKAKIKDDFIAFALIMVLGITIWLFHISILPIETIEDYIWYGAGIPIIITSSLLLYVLLQKN